MKRITAARSSSPYCLPRDPLAQSANQTSHSAKRDRKFNVYLYCMRPGQALANQRSHLDLQRPLASHRLAASV
jgi:hypothetical protein